jgi:hypothetical protein
MSTQKSRSKLKITIKRKPADYLDKYVGNTPEHVRRMREKFNEDIGIYKNFPYLTRGNDRDFHVFYEYIENKHLLDEKKIFPFQDARDYAFLYWFLDEIVPQNWNKLGSGKERERRKFKDGYYLNMSEIIEQSDLNKFESLISTTIFRGSRGIMPLPPLGEKDKNDSAKWRNWKTEYAKWKNQEYELHPELSRSRNERSAPMELDDDDENNTLHHNWNKILSDVDKKKFKQFDDFNKKDDRDPNKSCISKDKTPTGSDDVSKYYEQKTLFEEYRNEGCSRDAKIKKALLWDLFREQLKNKPCNIAQITRENDRIGKKDDGYYAGIKNDDELQEAITIFKNRRKFFKESISRFDKENNDKCKQEMQESLDAYIALNSDLFDIISIGKASLSKESNEKSFQDMIKNQKNWIDKRFTLDVIDLGKFKGHKSLDVLSNNSRAIGDGKTPETSQNTENLLFTNDSGETRMIQQLPTGKLNIYILEDKNFELDEDNVEPVSFIMLTSGGRQMKYKKTRKNRKSKSRR